MNLTIRLPNTLKPRGIIKKPNVLKLIKQQNQLHESWWEENPAMDHYYSGMFENKHYIYSFLDIKHANTCQEFLEKHKKLYGRYPCVLDNKPLKFCNNELPIFIEDETLESMKHRCLLNGIGLLGINHFSYTFIDSYFSQKNIFALSISAVDLLKDHDLGITDKIRHLDTFYY